MTKLPERVLADAFALSNARGADLLVHLGQLNVWRGDLSEMRGDEPRDSDLARAMNEPAPRDGFDRLALVRAIERLPQSCRDALAARVATAGASHR